MSKKLYRDAVAKAEGRRIGDDYRPYRKGRQARIVDKDEPVFKGSLEDRVDAFRGRLIIGAIRDCGSRSAACDKLLIHRNTLDRWITVLGLDVPESQRGPRPREPQVTKSVTK